MAGHCSRPISPSPLSSSHRKPTSIFGGFAMASMTPAVLTFSASVSSPPLCPTFAAATRAGTEAGQHAARQGLMGRHFTPGQLWKAQDRGRRTSKSLIAAAAAGGPATFLSPEEAGLIEMSKLDMHERFLARLTVSSLNLLRTISEQEGVPIPDLNAGIICDWFVKDKAKRETDINSATLKWDAGPEW